jgi:hypothetical protein
MFDFLGGFTAARIAKVRHVAHASIVGVISLVFAVVLVFLLGFGSLPSGTTSRHLFSLFQSQPLVAISPPHEERVMPNERL